MKLMSFCRLVETGIRLGIRIGFSWRNAAKFVFTLHVDLSSLFWSTTGLFTFHSQHSVSHIPTLPHFVCYEFLAHVWESAPICQPVKVYLSQCSTKIPLTPAISLWHFCFSFFSHPLAWLQLLFFNCLPFLFMHF